MHQVFIEYTNRIWNSGRLLLILLFIHTLATIPGRAETNLSEVYTEEKPLIIICNWEFPPFEFLNIHGEPIGYHIDLMDAIFKQMGVNYRIDMRQWKQETDIFDHHKADLIIDPVYNFRMGPYYSSRTVLGNYRLGVAWGPKARPITSFHQLKGRKVLIKSGDAASEGVIKAYIPGIKTETMSIKEALASIASGQNDYLVWGDRSIRWKLNELNLEENITLSDTTFIVGETRFVSYDQELIEHIDNIYARMMQSGELQRIRDKWLNPDKTHDNTSINILVITIIIFCVFIILLFLNNKINKRKEKASDKADDTEHMMQQAIMLSNYSVMEYDVKNDRFRNRNGNMLPEQGITMKEFIAHVHPDEQSTIIREMERLKTGQNGIWEMNKRWIPFTGPDANKESQWHFIHGHAIAEKDKKGVTKYIVNAVKDVTKEFEQERKDSEMASQLIKMFESTLVAMSFYNKDGQLIDLNENMRKLCAFDSKGEKYFREVNLFDIQLFKGDFDPKNPYMMHVCQHMVYESVGIDKYIEFRIKPSYDSAGELIYFIITAHDITRERELYIEHSRQEKELRNTSDKILQYEKELNYLLKNSNMWVWNSDIHTQTINFSRTLRTNDYTITFKEYMENLYDDEQRAIAMKAHDNMEGTNKNFNVTLHFKKSPVTNVPQWISVNGIPIYDNDGQPTGHFGVVREVTSLMEAREQLMRETNRAEDSGKLKSVFLANMTHEIRTPLNAIVGFSDLLQVIDDPQERREFIRIIRNNCDMLIRLINDIIEASNMNQGPLTIENEEVDFAVAFSDICQSLAQRVEEPDVQFIVDNPYPSFIVKIDKGRMQQVITNFTTNAVKYTHKGHIKVGYRYIDENELSQTTGIVLHQEEGQPKRDGLYMYCEDTGAGIPKDKQAAVFERFVKLNDFVQGTGLGLSICKSIADRCEGHIGVMSDGEGQGSTFWIWIPCQRKDD